MLRILTLEKDQDYEATIFRLHQGTSLRLVLGSSLLGLQVKLFINYPKDDKNFDRSEYQEIFLQPNISKDPNSTFTDILLNRPGTFHYYLDLISVETEKTSAGYLLVEPIICVGDNEETLRLNSIQCQTYLSKCLGYFENWPEKLEVAYRSGYNAIHFTPVQELGGSKSAYSIRDHRKLNPNFNFENATSPYTIDDLSNLIEKMRREWKIVSFTDIVLNHTANETQWLQEHPECAYNLTNSPHLRPAYLLDRALWHVTLDINSGKWESSNLPKEITSEEHLNRLRDIIKSYYLPIVRIYEMFMVNVDELSKEYENLLKQYANGIYKFTEEKRQTGDVKVTILQNPTYERFKCKVNMDFCIRKAITMRAGRDLNDWIQCSVSTFRHLLSELNSTKQNEIQFHLNCAVENVISAVRYERLDPNGPKYKFVCTQHPLVPQYFTHYGPDTDFLTEEAIIYDSNKNVFVMAHNGWVMGDDALRNFAGPDSNVYLRRELIAWGDSVKLRFGKTPEDCPFLWQYMREYVEQTAKIFHGIRLDNCHSTPLEVATYLIDAARQVRPNLFVIAELFTSSEYLDNVFVNRLGINSLIRESMSCPDSHELGRLLHRFGGDPVGAFDHRGMPSKSVCKGKSDIICKPLHSCVAHAILFDQTHDNESPFQKRTAFDLLPTSALVAMSCSATGSNRGYDELVPHHIHVVNEKRVYSYWDDDAEAITNAKSVNYSTGMILARSKLNALHKKLSTQGYSEIFVDQIDVDTVAVTRFNPNTLQSVLLIARTAFTHTDTQNQGHHLRQLKVSGNINKILFEMCMCGHEQKYKANDFVINGVKEFVAEVREDISSSSSQFVHINTNESTNSLSFVNFKPSSVIALELQLSEENIKAVQNIQELAKHFCDEQSEIMKLINSLSLSDLNYAIFRCNQEECDEGKGSGVYNVPGFHPFNYCGLAGLMFYWKNIRSTNDLGHPICANLREGLWLPNYISNRFLRRPSTESVGKWLQIAFAYLTDIPNYLVPRYFDLIITQFYALLIEQCWKKMNTFIAKGNGFVQLLAFGSIALTGYNQTSPLPPLSSKISKPVPEVETNPAFPKCITIAAGLTHFVSGYMRNWGRDTFISLRGILLTTGRYDEARYIILGFGGVLRHGLIPNLLDKGLNARYNCRDAVWFWLQSIKDYLTIVPNGVALLEEPVNRLYPSDDSEAVLDGSFTQPLKEVMQEALQRHFRGISFVERNAGKRIDEQMREEGFSVNAGISLETGFPYGGNSFNCGTWMDKMGSSNNAGNAGCPATPRDGSAVELVGLCYSIVSWLQKLYKEGSYSHEGVTGEDCNWTWDQWAQKLKANFEKNFWIAETAKDEFINRRGIYKDTIGATEKWRDFQFRPNFVICMAVAPELFIKENARKALSLTDQVLMSRLGMRTLDPNDWNYNGDYINSDNSNNYKTANGFNYHNGPEWLWPVGYYLRARLHFAEDLQKEKSFLLKKLVPHYQHLEQSDWFGLPELTNSNGSFCSDSCVVQAWSHSSLLDFFYDMEFNF